MKTLADLTAPREIEEKPLLESDVQKQCVGWARRRGYWARKFSSMSQRSVPDYLFARDADHTYHAIKFATEFKRPGKTSTEAQLDEQKAMLKAGWYVFECDNLTHFQRTVLAYEEASRKWG